MDAKNGIKNQIIAYCVANTHKSKYIGEDWHRGLNDIIDGLSQAILDAGFVRIEDIKIDVEKLKEIILPSGEVHPFLTTGDGKQYYFCNVEGIIKVIHEAKGILKIKGVKG